MAMEALLALRIYVGTYSATDVQRKAADVSKDSVIDTTDALLMLRFYVGNIKSFDQTR